MSDRATAASIQAVGTTMIVVLLTYGWLANASVDDRYDAVIRHVVAEVGGRYPVPVELVRAVIKAESSFRPNAVSRAGARGLMQVMPGTAVRVGIRPEYLFDPVQNIRAGVRLLSVLLTHYRGDIISSLVAYNARPRKLYAPIPRNGETPAYVWKVLSYYEWYSGRRDLWPGHRRSAASRRIVEQTANGFQTQEALKRSP